MYYMSKDGSLNYYYVQITRFLLLLSSKSTKKA